MPKIYFVVESRKWVQFSKYKFYKKYQKNIKLRCISIKIFKMMWILGLLRNDYIIFSSWRLVITFFNKNLFKDYHYKKFMACVTSHSNLNDNLIDKKKRNQQLTKALVVLSKFRIVTANSMILYKFLSDHLNNLYYSPNGVDNEIFTNELKKTYDPENIVIGFVAKDREVKRIDLLKKIQNKLKYDTKISFKPVIIPRSYKSKTYNLLEMSKYYKNIDFYLCLSNQEGTPNPSLEAASSGCLIITTKVGNMPELIVDKINSYFIDQDVDNITKRIRQISKMTKNEYYSMSKKLKKEIDKNWSWKVNSYKFSKIIEVLIS